MIKVWFLLVYIGSVVAWSYMEQDKWTDKFPICGSVQRQSPIAFNTNEALLKITPPMKYSQYDVQYYASINNNGHGIDIRLQDSTDKPTISGGPLPPDGIFQFDNVHFHWGSDDGQGSEHLINNKHYSAEIHAVHYNTKYKDLPEATQFPDGIAVVTAFYRTNSSADFRGLQNISSTVPPLSKSLFRIKNFKLADLFGGLTSVDKGSFYSYVGSLTTPPCSEVVTWIIYNKPLDVNPKQLEQFRYVRDAHGNLLVNNYRRLQSTNGRKVYFVQY
ncbi:carbonic anhydrase 2-like [Musca vetustissima]|uniref:carbonic anhydrase 2-like n=1 Tax=Musca vetustissima TaxID=27455 RepID=UPI002AB68B6F|nr:carbonic anhydrase 2-like [Musca vetustissima]